MPKEDTKLQKLLENIYITTKEWTGCSRKNTYNRRTGLLTVGKSNAFFL